MRGPELETARLRLRPLSPEDLDVVHAIWNHPEVRRYLWDGEEVARDRSLLLLRESEIGFRERGLGIWGLVHRGGGEEIGFCGFRYAGVPDLVYGLLPEYWGLGLATEAARAAIHHAFSRVGLERITASADTENRSSLRVMERVGMRFRLRAGVDGRELTTFELTRRDCPVSAAPG